MKPDEFDPERQHREDDLERRITEETSSINKHSIPLSDGRFVTSEDYEKLEAERDEARRLRNGNLHCCCEVDAAGEEIVSWCSLHGAVRAERDELQAEVKRLRECMRLAELQAFMRDKNPEEIASHLKYVMNSYADHEKKLEAEVKRLREWIAEKPCELGWHGSNPFGMCCKVPSEECCGCEDCTDGCGECEPCLARKALKEEQ